MVPCRLFTLTLPSPHHNTRSRLCDAATHQHINFHLDADHADAQRRKDAGCDKKARDPSRKGVFVHAFLDGGDNLVVSVKEKYMEVAGFRLQMIH